MSNVVSINGKDGDSVAQAASIVEEIEALAQSQMADKASTDENYNHFSQLTPDQLNEAVANLVTDLIQSESDKKLVAKKYGDIIKGIKEQLGAALAVRRDRKALAQVAGS